MDVVTPIYLFARRHLDAPPVLRSGQRASGTVLQTEQPRGVAPQDKVAVCRREVQLLDQRIRVFDGLIGAEGVVRTDYHAVGADEANQETEGFRIERDGVVMKSPDILLEGALHLELASFQAVLEPSGKIRETAAGMR